MISYKEKTNIMYWCHHFRPFTNNVARNPTKNMTQVPSTMAR